MIIDKNRYREKYNNVFLKINKAKFSAWTVYQLIFTLWVIHAKLTKRKFNSTKKDLENALKETTLSGNLIDIGGGGGWMSNYWKGDGEYVVVDPKFRKETLGLTSYKKGKLIFVQELAENIPFCDNFFDTGLLCATIDHVKSPKKVIEEASRVIKRNGNLFISHKVDHNDKGYNIGHINPLSENQLKTLFRGYFKIVKELKSPDKKVVYIYLQNIGA